MTKPVLPNVPEQSMPRALDYPQGVAPNTLASLALGNAVTKQYDFLNATIGGDKLFSVRGGIPLTDAFDQLTLLLLQGQSVVEGMCLACSSEEIPDASHAAVRLLCFADALVQSMHCGLIEHERAGNTAATASLD